MIAVDTNVVVRLLVGDDPEQARRATDLFAREPEIFVAKTVVLETVRVLRSVYDFDGARAAEAVQRLGGLANVVIEDAEQVAQALDRVGQGIDVADALHLAASPDGARLCTFDTRLVRRGAEQGLPVFKP